MNRKIVIPVVMLLALTLPAGAASGVLTSQTPAGADPVLVPHPIIRIVGDEGPLGFTVGHDPVTGTPIYRPGSGVTAGSGTAEDPYVISGWAIVPSPPPALERITEVAITIEHTSAHVVIAGNLIQDAVVGVLVRDATNVVIRGNDFAANWIGVRVDGGGGVTVSGNRIVENDPYAGSLGYGTIGVQLLSSHGNVIRGNEILHPWTGIRLHGSSGNLVEENLVADNLYGVHVTGIGLVARGTDGSDGNVVRHNTVESYQNGMTFEGARGNVVTNNTIGTALSSGFLIKSDSSVENSGNTVRGNNVDATHTPRGVWADSGQEVQDFTGNWWGCAEGPDAEGCTTTYGSRGEVIYDPWLAEPNPDAGASWVGTS